MTSSVEALGGVVVVVGVSVDATELVWITFVSCYQAYLYCM